MMNVSRFLKGGFNDFERSCLWDLRPIRIDNCQPLGKAFGGPGGDGPGLWRRTYIQIPDIQEGTRRNAQLLPRISLMN